MKIVLIIACVLALASADQFVPIPKTAYGFTFGAQDGQFHLQAFLDLLCPDSKDSYETLKNVMKTVDFKQKGIKFTFQHVPLPYHFYSYKIHQAFIYVQNHASQSITMEILDYFFEHQSQFSEETLMNYSISQFLDELSALVSSLTTVNKSELRKQLEGFSSTDYLTRYHWKYSMEVHGIPGAPLFAANSVIVDGAQDFGFDDWVSFLEKYVN